MFDLKFQGQSQGHNIDTYFFEFCDINSVLIDTKRKFLRYIPPEIAYWIGYVMLDLEFPS